ncbi:response regulator [Cytophaga aurantiaca]|uniref:response regulator n=1 Tax=Cytophaga aurantiaca TaxID=29530 RepID=UPI00035F3100|nr:response regulator [Cytophaga aurantiaca]
MCLSKNIYLADDDEDDRLFFQDALSAVCNDVNLTIAKNGIELMDILYLPPSPLPDVIFLDLNMPTKNGFECLEEIKKNETLKHLPVIIFSTTVQEEAVNKVYKEGANFYIRKPDNFNQLKKILKKVLTIDWLKEVKQISKEQFIVSIA